MFSICDSHVDKLLFGGEGDVRAPGAEGHQCASAALWILVRRDFREEVTFQLMVEGGGGSEFST